MRENEAHAGDAGGALRRVSLRLPLRPAASARLIRTAYLLTVSASAMSSFRFVGIGFALSSRAIQVTLWAR